jgi:cold-inducible RNA-binding protein
MKKLYVGNLSFSVTEENIRSEFAGLGIQTDSITVVRDRETGQPRGFGFVEISDNGAAEKAIASLNGKDLMGRALVVNEARPQAPRRDGGGYGGARGGRSHGGGSRRY